MTSLCDVIKELSDKIDGIAVAVAAMERDAETLWSSLPYDSPRIADAEHVIHGLHDTIRYLFEAKRNLNEAVRGKA